MVIFFLLKLQFIFKLNLWRVHRGLSMFVLHVEPTHTSCSECVCAPHVMASVECRSLNLLPPPVPPGEEALWIWTPSRTKNKICQRAEKLHVSQRLSISGAQLCLRTSCCSGLPFLGGWCQELHSGHHKNTSLSKSPWVNPRRSLQMGACNVLSRRDGDGPGICLGNG